MGENNKKIIDELNLQPGRIICRKYEIISQLGVGWEGKVYKIQEISTGIERAAKLFYPDRNVKNKTATLYARKLHKLRHCPILIQYHTQEEFIFKRTPITVLISEYVSGELLADFLKRQRGKRLSAFQGLHLLYALIQGLEQIHLLNEYHGDLHDENIIISRFGLGFEIKLLDTMHWPNSRRLNMQDDLVNAIKLFYEVIGGQKHYAKQPAVIKNICCGLKRSLILKKFKSSFQLREHLESLSWE